MEFDHDQIDRVNIVKVLAGAGALLGLGMVAGSFHHGGPIVFYRADHRQRQHLEMAIFLTAGSLASRFGKIRRVLSGGSIARIGRCSSPTARNTARVGMGPSQHKRLGKTILAAATTHTVGNVLGIRWIRVLGAGFLVASGLQLLDYGNERTRNLHGNDRPDQDEPRPQARTSRRDEQNEEEEQHTLRV